MKSNKPDKLEFWYKTAKALAVTASLFWIAETLFFLAVEGWHLTATSPAEVWCDSVVEFIFSGVGFALFMCFFEMVESEIRQRRNFDEIIRKATKESTAKKMEGLKDEDLTKYTAAIVDTNGKLHDIVLNDSWAAHSPTKYKFSELEKRAAVNFIARKNRKNANHQQK